MTTTALSTPEIPIDIIDRQWNLRGDVGDTSELEGSIENIGLIEPLVVRPNGDNSYVLLAGFRRLQALTNLGHTMAPVRVVDHPEKDAETARISLQLVENLQREELTPLEEASGYSQLKQYGWKQAEIAKRIGRSQAHVSKRLSLLDLPDTAIDLAESGRPNNESLYELSRVAGVGGNVDGIVDQLVENHQDDDEPISSEEVGVMARGALRAAEAAEQLSARKTEYEGKGIKVKIVDTDDFGQPQLPKDRIGYSSIDLDHDAHLKEVCALLVLYVRYGSVYESQHCTDRRRHAPDGASKLKLAKKPQSPENKSRRRGVALTESAEAALDGRQPARDRIVERMAVLYLDRLEALAHKRAAKFLGVEAELKDEYRGLTRLYEESDAANRTRILFAAVLAHGHQRSTGAYGAADDGHLEFLADIGQPVDLDKVAKGAEIDAVVEEAIAEGKAKGL